MFKLMESLDNNWPHEMAPMWGINNTTHHHQQLLLEQQPQPQHGGFPFPSFSEDSSELACYGGDGGGADHLSTSTAQMMLNQLHQQLITDVHNNSCYGGAPANHHLVEDLEGGLLYMDHVTAAAAASAAADHNLISDDDDHSQFGVVGPSSIDHCFQLAAAADVNTTTATIEEDRGVISNTTSSMIDPQRLSTITPYNNRILPGSGGSSTRNSSSPPLSLPPLVFTHESAVTAAAAHNTSHHLLQLPDDNHKKKRKRMQDLFSPQNHHQLRFNYHHQQQLSQSNCTNSPDHNQTQHQQHGGSGGGGFTLICGDNNNNKKTSSPSSNPSHNDNPQRPPPSHNDNPQRPPPPPPPTRRGRPSKKTKQETTTTQPPPKSTTTSTTSNISFQREPTNNNNNTTSTSGRTETILTWSDNTHNHDSSSCEPDAEAIQQMKEMIYRAAAFRPVNLGCEDYETTGSTTTATTLDNNNHSNKKPRRKNVRISTDPQTVAARQRRERISERLRVLQKLVPGGSKMDTASMLDEAANYLKYLRTQVKKLENMGTTTTNSSTRVLGNGNGISSSVPKYLQFEGMGVGMGMGMAPVVYSGTGGFSSGVVPMQNHHGRQYYHNTTSCGPVH